MRPVSPEDLTARARLRHAALKLFAERGFQATSVRAIAAAAGVSPALLTHHFGSKERLRAEVDDEVLRIFDDALEQWGSDLPAGDLLATLGAMMTKLFGDDPEVRGYLRRALLEESEASATLFSRLVEGARRELARLTRVYGARDDLDPQWAPFQVLFLGLGPLLLEPVMQPNLDVDAFDADVVSRRSTANQRLILHGLLGTGDAPS